MATVIAFRRPSDKEAGRKRETDRYSSEQFWRKSMVPASAVMGAIIIISLGGLAYGLTHGIMSKPWGTTVLVTAAVSIIGLTKIIIANMFFYIMILDDARLAEEEPPPPEPSRKTVALRRVARAIPTPPRRHQVNGRKRAAVLRSD